MFTAVIFPAYSRMVCHDFGTALQLVLELHSLMPVPGNADFGVIRDMHDIGVFIRKSPDFFQTVLIKIKLFYNRHDHRQAPLSGFIGQIGVFRIEKGKISRYKYIFRRLKNRIYLFHGLS